jgi:hypothetical protein
VRVTQLGGIGDPNSELNVQRRLQWLRERDSGRVITVSEEEVRADPALKLALLEKVPFLRLGKLPE